MLWKNRAILILLALPLSLYSAHLGRVVVQQDFIPSAVVGKPYSYPCAAAGQGGAGYTYSCVAPACVMPAGLSINAAGLITGTPLVSGSTDTQMGLTAAEGSLTQGLRVEVIRAESWDAWCPRGHFGGNVSTVALDPQFTANNRAMAGATNGGLLSTTDYGLTWSAEDAFGPQPVGALGADQCASAPMLTWAVTLPINSSWITDVGPSGNVADLNTGGIFRYNGSLRTAEAALPGTWTGANRKIRQAHLNCFGPTSHMVASDDEGGILWRDGATGGWIPANAGLPNVAGKIHTRDVVYGHEPNHNLAATLISYPDNSVAAIYRTILTNSGATWTACTSLKTLTAYTGRWQALGMVPAGGAPYLLAGTSRGEVARQTLGGGAFNNCGTLSTGPGLFDGATQVYPAINGFVVPACYTGVAGNRPVYAYTDGGVFYTPDVLAAAAQFQRIGKGLLSEEIAAMGLANSATCADNRMILGTRRQGAAFGDLNGFCHGQIRATASLNAIAGTQYFNSPGAQACGGAPGTVPLHAGSANSGVYRATSTGKEFFTAGDTRELAITDITSAKIGSADTLYALTNSGVYQSGGSNGMKYNFSFTKDPLRQIRGAPTSLSGRAYGISSGWIYASDTTPTPWDRRLSLGGGTTAVDLAAGGPLTGNDADDEMWIANGVGGLLEFQYIANVPTLVTQNGLAGLDVRRVAASRIPNASNAIIAQVLSGGTYTLRSGIKDTTPSSQITFATRAGTGLPTNEEAVQIAIEPGGSGPSAHVWALLPTQGLYYSTNAGGSFTRATAGLPANYIPRAILPANDYNGAVATLRDVALLVAGKGVYYSRDGGATFCFGPAALSDVPIGIRSVASRRTDLSQLPGPPPPLQYDDIIAAGTDQGVFYSDDNGAHWQNRSPSVQKFGALLYHPITGGNVLLAGGEDGIHRSTNEGITWVRTYSTGVTGSITAITRDFKGCTNEIVATRSNGDVLVSTDDGATFIPYASPADGAAVDRADGTTCITGGGSKAPSAATAPYWMAGISSGASWSPTGAAWTAANGANPDYLLPTANGFASVRNIGGSPSQVMIGHASGGLYRTLDGGDSWRKVSGPGSGLESSSQNAAALLTATTPTGGTDVLVGMAGTTTGGVYLSGDGGEHWTILNNGFDPNSLNVATLVKTSCSGCPVQYYTGTYGSGVYTRTIPVVAPPTITGWCFAAGCNAASACVTTAPGGPEEGGQPLKLCGTGFLALPTVELGGVAAAGCVTSSATVITCTGTPPHVPGAVSVRVRNTNTRAGVAGQSYTYAAGAPRVVNSLLVAKSGNDANLSYTCTGCTAPLPRVYRSQNALFTLYVEQYSGGAGSYTNTGALAPSSNPSYFWSVE